MRGERKGKNPLEREINEGEHLLEKARNERREKKNKPE